MRKASKTGVGATFHRCVFKKRDQGYFELVVHYAPAGVMASPLRTIAIVQVLGLPDHRGNRGQSRLSSESLLSTVAFFSRPIFYGLSFRSSCRATTCTGTCQGNRAELIWLGKAGCVLIGALSAEG